MSETKWAQQREIKVYDGQINHCHWAPEKSNALYGTGLRAGQLQCCSDASEPRWGPDLQPCNCMLYSFLRGSTKGF